MNKYTIFLFLIFVCSLAWGKTNPVFTDSPNLNGIKYFVNDYTRQNDGVLTTSLTTSSDSLRLGGQLPSYYATVSGLNTLTGNIITSTTSLQSQITGLQNSATNYATVINVINSTTSLQNQLNYIPTTYANRNDVATSTASIIMTANNMFSSWTYTNNGLNAITGKISGGVQTYLAVLSTDTVKWYITISTQGRVWIQNFLP